MRSRWQRAGSVLRDREALEEFAGVKKRLSGELTGLDERFTEVAERIGRYAAQIDDCLDDFRYPRLRRYVDDLCATVERLDGAPLRVYAALARVAGDVLLDDWGTDYWAEPGKTGYTPSGDLPRPAGEEPSGESAVVDGLPGPAASNGGQDPRDGGEPDVDVLGARITGHADHISALFRSFPEVWGAVRSAAEIGDDTAVTFELAKLGELADAARRAFEAWAADVEALYERNPEMFGYVRVVAEPVPGQLPIF